MDKEECLKREVGRAQGKNTRLRKPDSWRESEPRILVSNHVISFIDSRLGRNRARPYCVSSRHCYTFPGFPDASATSGCCDVNSICNIQFIVVYLAT